MSEIEQVEQRLEILSYKASRKSVGLNASFQETLSSVLEVIRPVLVFFENKWYVSKRWKSAIRKIIQVLDAIQNTSTLTVEEI